MKISKMMLQLTGEGYTDIQVQSSFQLSIYAKESKVLCVSLSPIIASNLEMHPGSNSRIGVS